MTAWGMYRGFGIGATALVLLCFAAPVTAVEPGFFPPAPLTEEFESKARPLPPERPIPAADKPTAAQLRERAAAAEKIGDWEAAFSAYCELVVADRSSPALRQKLNAALRRVQQLRRHRDPAFQQFVRGLPTADAVNLFAEVTAKVPSMFADPAKATPQQLWANGTEEMDRALASPGFRQTFLDNAPVGKVETFRRNLRTSWAKRTIADTRDARAALKQLLAAAQDSFPVRVPAALALEFVCGACCGLDEYTVFLTPTQAADPAETTPDLSVYGLYLGFHDGGLVVDGIAPGSWVAFHQPTLRKGDRIAKVNGRPMDMGGPAALANALRYPSEGVHKLERAAASPDMRTSPVTLPVVIPTVWGRIVNPVEGIAHVRVSEFQPATPQDFAALLDRLRAEGMRALLLDLRGNRGGSFLAGVEVARRLLPAGLIVTTQGQLGQVAGQVFSSDSGMHALEVPIVVLIDAETASAAEVVAAALRDNNRAVLVGTPSFGKGTIQYPLRLAAADDPDDMGKPRGKSGTVRLTIARLIAPGGTPINGAGVTPQFIETDPARQWDRAIERALDLLGTMPTRSPMPLPPSH